MFAVLAEGTPQALAFYRRRGFRPDEAGKTVTEWEGRGTIRLVR